jgi:uncharacterized protein YfdQ (DUF2303 family)
MALRDGALNALSEANDKPDWEAAMRLGAVLSEPITGPDGQTLIAEVDSEGNVRYREFAGKDPDPKRIKAAPRFEEGDSFAEYVNEFKDLNEHKSQLFASCEASTLVAHLDYHAPGKPSRGEHRATFKPVFDPAFDAWRKVHGKPVSQDFLCRFVEVHAREIVVPDAASMLEMASDLNMKVDIKYASKKNLQTGLVQVVYTETSDGATSSGTLSLPKELTVKMPVFFGENPVEFQVALRLDVNKGEPIKFILDIVNYEYIVQEAFLLIAERIGQAVGIKPKFGAAG